MTMVAPSPWSCSITIEARVRVLEGVLADPAAAPLSKRAAGEDLAALCRQLAGAVDALHVVKSLLGGADLTDDKPSTRTRVESALRAASNAIGGQ